MGRALVNRGRSKRVFVNDDEQYANLFGLGGKKARAIDSQTDQIRATTDKLRAETDAQMKDINKQLEEAEEKTRQAKELEQQLKSKLDDAIKNKKEVEQVATTIKTQTTKTIQSENMKKYILIGAGIVGLIVVVALVTKN